MFEDNKITDFLILFTSMGALISYGLIEGEIGIKFNYNNIDDLDKFKLYNKIQLGLSGFVLLITIPLLVIDFKKRPNESKSSKTLKYVLYSFILVISIIFLILINIENFDNSIHGFNWSPVVTICISVLFAIYSISGIIEENVPESFFKLTGKNGIQQILKNIKQLNKLKIALISVIIVFLIFLTLWNVLIAPSYDFWPFTKPEISCPIGTSEKME